MSVAVASPHRTIREATIDDLPRLCELFEHFRSASVYAQYGPAQPEISTGLIEHLLTHDDGVVIVRTQDDRLTGMLGLIVSAHPWTGERMATELFWWLEPDARGQGVWLLRRAEDWAARKGAVRLIMVSPQSLDVDRIYRALGYAPVETSWQKPLDWFSRHTPRTRSMPKRFGITVHDDVLPDPHAYRAMALAQRFQAVHDGAVTFQRMAPCANPAIPLWIVQHYPQLTPTLTFFRQGKQDQAEPHYLHTDASMGDWTGILYLTPNPPAGDGTAFWRHVATGKTGSLLLTKDEAALWFDESVWERWHLVDAKFNRLVLFPASLYHSRAIPENYGHGDEARLTQNTFGTGALS